ncbi:MAG: DUF6442 family protein [Acutalibacteraceae bacterium]
MNKNEILEKSRKEHKNQDPYEKEVVRFAGIGGTIAAVSMCFILVCMEIFLGDGNPSGFQSILMATLTGEFLARGIKSKRIWEIVTGIICACASIFCLVAYIDKLVG